MQQTNHPSTFYTRLSCTRTEGSAAYLSSPWLSGRVRLRQAGSLSHGSDTQPFTLALYSQFRVNLPFMSLDCERNPTQTQGEHATQAGSMDSNSGPLCCGSTLHHEPPTNKWLDYITIAYYILSHYKGATTRQVLHEWATFLHATQAEYRSFFALSPLKYLIFQVQFQAYLVLNTALSAAGYSSISDTDFISHKKNTKIWKEDNREFCTT